LGVTEAGGKAARFASTGHPAARQSRKEEEVYEAAVEKRSRASGARSAEPKRGVGYAVYDPVGQKFGSTEEVFVNRDGDPVYIRVRIGLR